MLLAVLFVVLDITEVPSNRETVTTGMQMVV